MRRTRRRKCQGARYIAEKLYDQETERQLAKEVENRIEAVLSAGVWHQSCTAAAWGGHLDRLKYLHENGCAWDERACLSGG